MTLESFFTFSALLGGGSGDYSCPSSGSPLHASCKTTVEATGLCSAVREEMLARVAGQYATWHDPHNNGTYSVLDKSVSSTLQLQRVTGDKKYTDKITFTFEDTAAGTCTFQGCSVSQVTSVADFSTNYCNMYK